MFSADYSKRDYLLPKGCKDLIDVINLQASYDEKAAWPVGQPHGPSPAPKGDILLPDKMTLGEFAAIIGLKPFQIIADAMEMGVFANVKMYLGFEQMAHIARKYGYTARRSK